MNTVIIGFGNIAIKHLEVAKLLGIEVIASSNRSTAGNDLAKQHRIAKTYTNYLEMVETEKPDSIIVSVSFEHLFSVCKSLIPYGIPILLEKPAGTSLNELHQLIELANAFGTKVQVAMNRRHYNNIQKAIEHAGGWSQITAVDVEWSEDPMKLLVQKGYSKEQVAKIIFGNSIHGIDMATFFGGEIESPSITTNSFGEPFRWYMQFSGKSKEGKLVSFRSSWDHPVPWKLVLSSQGKRYVFAPLETCLVYSTNQKEIEEILIDDVEKEYKVGFLSQMNTFKNLVESPQFENVHSLESCIPAMNIADVFFKKLNS
jgi:predicted dehydrogenase